MDHAALDGDLDVRVGAEVAVGRHADIDVALPVALGIAAAERALGRVVGNKRKIAVEGVDACSGCILVRVEDDAACGLDVHVIDLDDVFIERLLRLIDDVGEGRRRLLVRDGCIQFVGQIQPAVADLPFDTVLLEVGKRRRVRKIVLVNHGLSGKCAEAQDRRQQNRRRDTAQKLSHSVPPCFGCRRFSYTLIFACRICKVKPCVVQNIRNSLQKILRAGQNKQRGAIVP